MFVRLFTTAVDGASIHPQKGVRDEERHSLVATYEGMVRKALHQGRRVLYQAVAIAQLRTQQGRCQSSRIAQAGRASKVCEEVRMDREDLLCRQEEPPHMASSSASRLFFATLAR